MKVKVGTCLELSLPEAEREYVCDRCTPKPTLPCLSPGYTEHRSRSMYRESRRNDKRGGRKIEQQAPAKKRTRTQDNLFSHPPIPQRRPTQTTPLTSTPRMTIPLSPSPSTWAETSHVPLTPAAAPPLRITWKRAERLSAKRSHRRRQRLWGGGEVQEGRERERGVC